jgi:hypothetical protein
LAEGLLASELCRNLDLRRVQGTSLSTVLAVGEYASAGDLSRAIALMITPMAVRLGLLSREQYPLYRIYAEKARQAFTGILEALYGDANVGCKLP